MPRGGRRPGAGRPRKTTAEKQLSGWSGKRDSKAAQRAALKEAAAEAPVVPIPRPEALTLEQAAVWAELAPHATALGTLTPASSMAFRDLCEAIAVKRALLSQILMEGWTVGLPPKAHPLLTRYQGIYQRVEAGFTRFGLSPMGEEMNHGAPPPKDEDPFSEFDADAAVN